MNIMYKMYLLTFILFALFCSLFSSSICRCTMPADGGGESVEQYRSGHGKGIYEYIITLLYYYFIIYCYLRYLTYYHRFITILPKTKLSMPKFCKYTWCIKSPTILHFCYAVNWINADQDVWSVSHCIPPGYPRFNTIVSYLFMLLIPF